MPLPNKVWFRIFDLLLSRDDFAFQIGRTETSIFFNERCSPQFLGDSRPHGSASHVQMSKRNRISRQTLWFLFNIYVGYYLVSCDNIIIETLSLTFATHRGCRAFAFASPFAPGLHRDVA